jgi:hypothetical protein
MSGPNPSTAEPVVVWNMEVNGAANIVQEYLVALACKRPINTTRMRIWARQFDSYVARLEAGEKVRWGDHITQKGEGL